MNFDLEMLFAICLGVGLSAACGFRIFLPLLLMGVASLGGYLKLSAGFEWLGSYPAVVTFAIATGFEIAGYFIPWVDHGLDALSTPTASIAGTIAMLSVLTDMDPFVKWTLAIIAGGGTAALIRGGTASVRGLSTLMTGGLGNPIVSLVELFFSIMFSILAIFLPLLGIVLLIPVVIWFWRKIVRQRSISVSPPATSLE